jgi:hypothetical protein
MTKTHSQKPYINNDNEIQMLMKQDLTIQEYEMQGEGGECLMGK